MVPISTPEVHTNTVTVRKSRSAVIDTLVIAKDGYRIRKIPIESYTELFNHILLSEVGTLYDPADLVNNDTVYIKSTSSYRWTDVAFGGDVKDDGVTSVTIDSSTGMGDTALSVVLVRKARENDSTDYKTAATGTWFSSGNDGSPMSALGKIIVQYMVKKPSDTLAFYLAPSSSESFAIGFADSSTGIKSYFSAFRAVLTNGADNPGTFVSDTLTLHDFTLKYGQHDSLLMERMGFTINDNGNVYLDENPTFHTHLTSSKVRLADLVFAVFENESDSPAGDTTELKVGSIAFIGDFYSDTVNGLSLIESNGWLPIYDSTSSLTTQWDNGEVEIELTRGVSNEAEGKWAYASVLGMLNSKGSLAKMRTLSMTYIVPPSGDTIALSIERGERIGAGKKDNYQYGSFRVPIPFEFGYDESDTLVPGDTITIDYSISDFTMNWGDDETALYQFGDTLDRNFLKEANAIGIFSEVDNGFGGDAEQGDTVSIKILDMKFRGPHGLELDLLPLIE